MARPAALGRGVAAAYGGLLDGMVADEPVDGLPHVVIDTLMTDAAGAPARGRGDAALRGVAAVSTIAVLPVKRFDDAKQRLGDALRGGTRRALAEAMLTDVLTALRRSKRVDAVVVVTSEHGADALAARPRRERDPRPVRARPQPGGARGRAVGDRAGRAARAARPRRLPGARPDRGRRPPPRPPAQRGARHDRARPPRHRHERARALPAGRDRAELRPRQPRAPRGARPRRRAPSAGSPSRRRSRSTSTRSRTSTCCGPRSTRGPAAPPTPAACSPGWARR